MFSLWTGDKELFFSKKTNLENFKILGKMSKKDVAESPAVD